MGRGKGGMGKRRENGEGDEKEKREWEGEKGGRRENGKGRSR